MRACVLAIAFTVASCARPGPVVTVAATAPGLAAPEVERYLTIPLEIGLGGIPSELGIRSRSVAGGARISVAFRRGTDPARARAGVLARLPSIVLPDGGTAGVVDDGPIAMRVVSEGAALSTAERAELFDRAVLPELARVPGVAAVERCGGEPQRLEARLDPQRLKGFGLSYAEVLRAMSDGVASGSAEVFGQSVVATRAGAPVRLRDLATVALASPPPRCLLLRDGTATVEARVRARPDADGRAVRAAVLATLSRIALPAPASLATFDAASAIHFRVALSPMAVDARAKLLVRIAEVVRRDPAAAATLFESDGDRGDVLDLFVVAPAARTAELGSRLDELPGLGDHLVEPGPPIFTVVIAGADRVALARIADELGRRLASPPRLPTLAYHAPAPRAKVVPDRRACARYGVNIADLDALVRAALDGEPLPKPPGGRAALLRLGPQPLDATQLRELAIPIPGGAAVPLSQIASIEIDAAPATLARSDGRPAVELSVQSVEGERAVRARIAEVALPPGYTVQLSRE